MIDAKRLMINMQLSIFFENRLKYLNYHNIYLGPWVTSHQCAVYPDGCARFCYNNERASLTFIEALELLDDLSKIKTKTEIEIEIWEKIKSLSIINPLRITDAPWLFKHKLKKK